MKKILVICVCLLMMGSVLAASAVVYAKKPENPGGGKPPKDEEKIAEGEETLITENPMWYRNDPRIFGDKIVWVDKYFLGPSAAIHDMVPGIWKLYSQRARHESDEIISSTKSQEQT